MSGVYLTALNFVLCSLWAWGSFSRLRQCDKEVLPRVRLIYTGMLVAATASGFQLQLFGEHAGYADVCVSCVMVLFIALGARRWRYGVPSQCRKIMFILR